MLTSAIRFRWCQPSRFGQDTGFSLNKPVAGVGELLHFPSFEFSFHVSVSLPPGKPPSRRCQLFYRQQAVLKLGPQLQVVRCLQFNRYCGVCPSTLPRPAKPVRLMGRWPLRTCDTRMGETPIAWSRLSLRQSQFVERFAQNSPGVNRWHAIGQSVHGVGSSVVIGDFNIRRMTSFKAKPHATGH